ncbi:MCE family protein [Hoyosella subflava]|uniref:MCE family protein n=1 Tax=Hoyosella subflava (strain DSM 45089 / JCM 17490 / NBRC 109087 / DQS3-9A1) TaxID=443218 RepID=F6EN28_HOYSD|nr:MlaD family protein [Hoyosella subflava]AEF39345.1 MCE family protein [Hoyosella subflava DQS3-9A1]
MMLTTFARAQLAILAMLSVIGIVTVSTVYISLPALAGVGRYDVTVEFEGSGGLYRHANVVYRGTTIGEVRGVELTPEGVAARLSVSSNYSVPADLKATVRSVSAVGEQYVDLIPQSTGGERLAHGAVIPVSETELPQDVGPLLDQLDRMVDNITGADLQLVVDEAFDAFAGADSDIQRLIDSASLLLDEAELHTFETQELLAQAGPLLDTQVASADDIRAWTRNLSTFTQQLRESDAALRSVIRQGPGAAQEANMLFQDIRPTLPILMANMVSFGEVGVTYHPGIEQVLVTFPPLIAALYRAATGGPRDEGALVDFHLQLNDPPACTTGFLPPSERRSPADFTTPDTPPGLFCQVAPEGPEAVRGARNTPCMEVPGRRAPTPEQCRTGYTPLGTNPPLGDPAPVTQGTVTPSTYDPRATARPYDTSTGLFTGPDGRTYSQPGLAGLDAGDSTDWKTMMINQQGL